MFLRVNYAQYLDVYRVHVAFNDGSEGDIDLSSSLSGEMFEPLRNVVYFKSFSIEGHTLTWPNGADFAPEYLHSLLQVPAGSSISKG
jgi:hypothetical protein